MKRSSTYVIEWAVAGFFFGLLFPLGSLIITVATDGWGAASLHWESPAMWMVNLAPIISLAVTLIIGGAHAKLSALQRQTAELAERVAHEWTAEIHDTNVAVAAAATTRAKFFAALSHDMRAPLTAIMGFAEIAEVDADIEAAELRGYLIDVGKWGGQLLSIVNDLMDATKLESGAIEIQVADVDGDDIVAQVVAHLRALADEEGLELCTELQSATAVRADPHRFRQVMINLLSNALKYTDEGWVKVRSYQIGDNVVYEVQDSGAGISQEDMPKVFTPFEQTEVALGRTDSTGLGLPVSLGMAQAMGGTISATSLGRGHGATFRLVLPMASGEEPELKVAQLAGIAAGR